MHLSRTNCGQQVLIYLIRCLKFFLDRLDRVMLIASRQQSHIQSYNKADELLKLKNNIHSRVENIFLYFNSLVCSYNVLVTAKNNGALDRKIKLKYEFITNLKVMPVA